MDLKHMLNEVKEHLKSFIPGLINSSVYVALRKQCAKLCLAIGGSEKELEAIYHLTEAHGVGLRQQGLQERLTISKKDVSDCLSFMSNDYAAVGPEGLLRRLKELPSEWTVIQLTREFEPMENLVPRPEGKAPNFKNFHLTRMPCGSCVAELPFTVDCSWPEDYGRDPIDIFWEVKRKWRVDTGAAKYINKLRKDASEIAENYCRDLSTSCFKVWRVFLLGTLIDGDLETEIRTRLNYILSKVTSNNDQIKISTRQRYMVYLLAEGSALISEEEIDLGLIQIFPDHKVLQDELFNEILAIKACYTQLPSARRHSVILILDDWFLCGANGFTVKFRNYFVFVMKKASLYFSGLCSQHLDLIPWESAAPFDCHPYCRMPSIHFIHLGYNINRNDIKDGFLEILECETCFYVLNPESDLPSEKIQNFLKTRFPSWVGVVNHPPTANQIIEALTSYKLFMYCGHGSGSQYLQSKSLMKIDNLQSIQFLIGCSSGALVDHGGDIEMTGDVLQYIAAGSGCAVSLLWSVTNTDADEMTMEMVNCLLPDTKANKLNTKKDSSRESELLRAVVLARKSANVFTNGAALVARGLPAKIVLEKT